MICAVLINVETTAKSALESITGEEYLALLQKLPLQWPRFSKTKRPTPVVSPMDWSSIYVYIGCCIVVLFKKFTDEENYKNFMIRSIHEMKVKAGCDPADENFDIPFDYRKANAVRTMFGAQFKFRSDAITLLVNTMNDSDTRLGGVCKYLCNMLSWYEMEHFNLLNDMLVNPRSPVLLDPRVLIYVRLMT